jgi:hypothetical protein
MVEGQQVEKGMVGFGRALNSWEKNGPTEEVHWNLSKQRETLVNAFHLELKETTIHLYRGKDGADPS